MVFRIDAFQVSKVSNYCVREIGEEVEFVTIMLFDSLGSFREFAGEDYAIAGFPRTREQPFLT